MDHDLLEHLLGTHPTLRLLAAGNAPLLISFFHAVFVKPNRRAVPASELASRLDDHLHALRQRHGEARYPKAAREYLDDWSGAQTPFLRRYYADLSDEPQFDLTPATERAIEWLRGLVEARAFVGTESRLMTIVQLLRDIVQNAAEDPEARIAELTRRRAEIEAEIARVRSGQSERFDTTRVTERFVQAEETARGLLADFRQVEHNFRLLDRATRERIAAGETTKGRVLDAVFDAHDVIWASAEGRSFRAFWEFLMSPARQQELDQLLSVVLAIEDVRRLSREPFIEHIRFLLLEAGEKVYRTNHLLVEQLRKFLDDKAYWENRRIVELIRSIERQAIEANGAPPEGAPFAWLDDLRPDIELVMSRGLFTPPRNPVIGDVDTEEPVVEVDMTALYGQTYVDEKALRANVRRALQDRAQVTLGQLLAEHPPTQGVAEVVAYLSIAAQDGAVFDEAATESALIPGGDEQARRVTLPQIIFVR
ncbi:DUF3375 domain-containing protein [Sorangium sp. So ce1389]|uniref:DUF3375 domain-containing protein n=1 Tax=Sorangium sp. So ce1389 TaxID=3133336 RepID=UPI003F604B2E